MWQQLIDKILLAVSLEPIKIRITCVKLGRGRQAGSQKCRQIELTSEQNAGTFTRIWSVGGGHSIEVN